MVAIGYTLVHALGHERTAGEDDKVIGGTDKSAGCSAG